MSAKVWHCVSAGSCIASFITVTLPYLQYLAVIIAIVSGIRAWRKDKK